MRSVLLIIAVSLIGPSPARAQAAPRLATLQVSLWPEFDQPATLVILDGQLEAATALPADLAVRIPARAGPPHAVAVTSPGGDLLSAAYTTQPAGDDIIVMFQTQSPAFRVEYYDPALTIDNEARAFAFQWRTDYAIAAVAVRVQQPVGARDLVGQPVLTSVGAGADGLTYYQADLGALAPGDTAALRFSYAKSSAALSAGTLGGAALSEGQAGPAPQTVTPRADNTLLLIVGGAALGLALAAFVLVRYTRARRPVRATAPARRSRRPSAPASQGAYCTQCGHALLAGDRFCRSCGARAAS